MKNANARVKRREFKHDEKVLKWRLHHGRPHLPSTLHLRLICELIKMLAIQLNGVYGLMIICNLFGQL